MKQWLLDNLNWLVPCIASVFSGSSICTIITLVRTRTLSKALEKARESGYHAKCPRCHKTILFKECEWSMPDGVLDNNFNGIPDNLEKQKTER